MDIRLRSRYITIRILPVALAILVALMPSGILANAVGQGPTEQSAAAATTAAPLSGSLDGRAGNHQSRTISVSGSSVARVSPDTATISFGIENQESTARQAAEANAAVAAKVIASLKDVGVSPSDIGTSYYSIYPVYEYREERGKCSTGDDGKMYCPPPVGKQVLIGYKALNSITIQSSQLDKSGEWIDAAISAGANRVDSLSFLASQQLQNKIRTQLISEAIIDARNQANAALVPLGKNVTDVLSVNLSGYPIIYPKRGFENSGSASPSAISTPIIPGVQEVTLSAQVTFEIGDASQGRQLAGRAIDNASSVTTSPNQNFKITLESNPTTGYQWDVAVNTNANVAKFVSSDFLPSESGLLGAGGKQVLTFQALNAGQATIVLEYARPWDKGNPIEVHLIYLMVG